MTDDTEIDWHKEQIAKNRAILEELETGNTAGGDVFPETQSEINRIKAQITQSALIVAAYEKEHPEKAGAATPQRDIPSPGPPGAGVLPDPDDPNPSPTG